MLTRDEKRDFFCVTFYLRNSLIFSSKNYSLSDASASDRVACSFKGKDALAGIGKVALN